MAAINYLVDRVVQMKDNGQVVRFIKGTINSKDLKPTIGIYDRSTLYEEDTGNYYVFNQKLNKWQLHDPDDGGHSGGGDLPDPSQASEGDVLTVDDGSAVWSAPTGGCSCLIVTYDSINGILNKTWKEISDAMQANKPVFIIYGEYPLRTMLMVNVVGYNEDIEQYYVHVLSLADDPSLNYYCADSENDYPGISWR